MLYYFLLLLFFLLPVQVALNPTLGIDLAFLRLIIPLFFMLTLFVALKNKTLIISKNKTTLFVFSFIFLAVFSFFYAQNNSWYFRKILFIFSLVPIYFIIENILTTETKIKKGITFLVYGASFASIIGIFQFSSQFIFGLEIVYAFWAKHVAPIFIGNSFSEAVLTYPSWIVNVGGKDYMRLISVFPDPHMFAFYLGMILPWSLALFFTNSDRKTFFLFSSLLILIADLLTFSRGGYLGLVAGLLFIAVFIYKKFNKKIYLLPIFILFLFMLIPNNPVFFRLSSSFNFQEGSNKERILIWKKTLLIIKDKPLGVGLGNYSLQVDPRASYRDPIYAHSLYLDIAAELGLFALIFWLLIIFTSIQNFLVKSKENTFYLAGAVSIIIFSAHSLVENSLFSVHILTLLLIFIAISNHKKNVT